MLCGDPNAIQIRVEIDEIQPPIWRSLVPTPGAEA
jgi:hypothetical protein